MVSPRVAGVNAYPGADSEGGPIKLLSACVATTYWVAPTKGSAGEAARMFTENGALDKPPLVTTIWTGPKVLSNGVNTLIWSEGHCELVAELQK